MLTDNNRKLDFSSHYWFNYRGIFIMYMHGITFVMHPICYVSSIRSIWFSRHCIVSCIQLQLWLVEKSSRKRSLTQDQAWLV